MRSARPVKPLDVSLPVALISLHIALTPHLLAASSSLIQSPLPLPSQTFAKTPQEPQLQNQRPPLLPQALPLIPGLPQKTMTSETGIRVEIPKRSSSTMSEPHCPKKSIVHTLSQSSDSLRLKSSGSSTSYSSFWLLVVDPTSLLDSLKPSTLVLLSPSAFSAPQMIYPIRATPIALTVSPSPSSSPYCKRKLGSSSPEADPKTNTGLQVIYVGSASRRSP